MNRCDVGPSRVHRVPHNTILGRLLCLLAVAIPVYAQPSPHAAPGAPTNDTGAFAPDRRAVTSYTTPALCVAAANRARILAQRTLDAQTRLARVWNTPVSDTLPV